MGDLLNLRSSLGKQGVKWLLPSYVDMHGVSKSKVVPLSHFANMMAGSEMYTGAALDGVVRSSHRPAPSPATPPHPTPSPAPGPPPSGDPPHHVPWKASANPCPPG